MTNRAWSTRMPRLAATALLALTVVSGLKPLEAGAAQGEEQTLTIWDTQVSGVQAEIVETLAEEFEASHPGVTVEHRGLPLEELQDSLQRSVSSGEGPDIAQINNGESAMGPMVRAGLLVPMDSYADQYGWRDILSPALIARNSYTEDGRTFGEGVLWGMSSTAEIVGFYYNKQIFADNGIEIPQTFADFEAALQTLADAGVTPIVFGNLDQWQAIHLFGEVHGTMTTREYLDGLIYHRGDLSWDTDEIKNAAAKVQEWKDAGYFLEGFEGLNGDDAWPLFAAGEGAMLLQGSWQAGDLAANMGENVGFFLMPPVSPEQPVLHVGGVGIPYGITTNAENPDLAAEFVDFLVSDRAVELLVELSQLPSRPIPADQIPTGTLAGDIYTAFNAASEADAIGHYMDWATPTFYDTITAGLQELLAGEIDPQTFATRLQEDYAAFMAEQGQ
jgi:raffinose/stachyose/melibiose transport system substrate-binding protein